MRSHVTFGPATGVHRADHIARSIPDRTTFELASGKDSISVISHLSRGSGAGLQLSDGDGEQLDMDYKEADLTHENIAVFLEGFSETISVSSNESHEWKDPEEQARDQHWFPSDIPSPKCIFRSRSLGEASPPKLFVFNLSLPGKCRDLASLLSHYMISHRSVIFLPISSFCFTLANIHDAKMKIQSRSSVVFTS